MVPPPCMEEGYRRLPSHRCPPRSPETTPATSALAPKRAPGSRRPWPASPWQDRARRLGQRVESVRHTAALATGRPCARRRKPRLSPSSGRKTRRGCGDRDVRRVGVDDGRSGRPSRDQRFESGPKSSRAARQRGRPGIEAAPAASPRVGCQRNRAPAAGVGAATLPPAATGLRRARR